MVKIRSGYSEHCDKQELAKLVDKITALSGYNQSPIAPGIFAEDEESDSFYKVLDDNHLGQTALLYIFMNKSSEGHFGFDDLLPEVFKSLSFRKQWKFIGYYNALRPYAIQYGFLSKYETISNKLNIKGSWLFKIFLIVLGICISLFIISLFVPSDFIIPIGILLLFINNSHSDNNSNAVIINQNDCIIKYINRKEIGATRIKSANYLKEEKWID